MYSDDELEYEDLDDETPADDDEASIDLDDDDEEDSAPARPRTGSAFGSLRSSGTSPFSSGSGSSPFGARAPLSRSGGDDESPPARENPYARPSGSTFPPRTTGTTPPSSGGTAGSSGSMFGSARPPSSNPFGSRPATGEGDAKDDDKPRSSFGSGGSSPFGNRPTGGSSPFGSRTSPPAGDDDAKDDDKPRSGLSGGSPFTRGGTPPPSSGGSRPGTGPLGSGSPSSGATRPGTGPLGSGSPSGGATRPGTGPLGSGSHSGSSSNLPGRPSSFGSGGGFAPRTPAPADDKKDAPKPDEKKEDAKPAGGGIFSRPSNVFGGKPAADADKKDAPKPDGDKPASGNSLGGIAAGIGSRMSFGGKPAADADKKDAPKPDGDKPASGNSLGGIAAGIGSRMSFGSKPAADADKKDAPKPDGDKPVGGNMLGNLRNRFGGGGDAKKDGDAPAEGKGGIGSGIVSSAFNKPKPAPEGEVKPTAARSGGSLLGNRKPAEPDAKPAKGKKEDDKDGNVSPVGGRFAAIRSSLPFLNKREAATPEKPASKTVRQSKAPQVKQGLGLSLDRKLDILGVGLVLVSLALILSRISANQGVLTESVNRFLGQLLGWGALAVPLVMFAVGMWLIIRHFGDEPPTIDTERIVGVAIIYIGLLILFQFVRSLSYPPVPTLADLELQTRLSWEVYGNGGGWVGGNLYLLLVRYVGEVLAFSLNIFLLIVGIMFLADVSVSEVAIIAIGIYRSFSAAQRRANERKRVRRAERLAMRREQVAALAPPPSTVEISKPQAAPLAAGAAGALPAPTEDRAIQIKVGGQTLSTPVNGAQNAASAPQPISTTAMPAPPSTQPRSGGIFNKALSAVGLARGDKAPLQASAPQAAPVAVAQPVAVPMPSTPTPAPQPAAATPPADAPPPPESVPPVASAPAPTESAPPTSAPPAPTSQPAAPPESAPPSAQAAAPMPPNPTTDRLERLNAIRQGIGGHPSAAAQPAPTPTPPTDAPAPPSNVQIGKTDAYGNQPTAPSAITRPDQLRPEPSVVNPPRARRDWKLPDINELLNEGSEQDFDRQFLVEQARIIEDTLRSFGAPGRVVEINTGPVITQYGVEPDYLQSRTGKKSRVKVSAIAQLDRDLQLALGARSIRIEAPVPGKGYVGIEIPNAENALVSLKDVLQADQFKKIGKKSPLAIALGQSVDGTPVAADLSSMPHLLVAGTTGSGKSVCINAVISSLLANNSPEQLKFIMVDPKRVELTGYNGIPHLVAPVVVELERIVGVLKWVTREMDERYKRFSTAGARNIIDFNQHLPAGEEQMPYIVVIIDELADLMMLAPEETERTITRIAALARATGIHLVIATQRPSVDVVTGLIKANFPARIAFAVAGSVDSRVILDQPGAERLLGRGDMLYLSGDSPAPQRLQGVYVSDEEIDNITRYWKSQSYGTTPTLSKGMAPLSLDPATAPRQMTPSGLGMGPTSPLAGLSPSAPIASNQNAFWNADDSADDVDDDDNSEPDDEMYNEAVELVRRMNRASVSLLQRRLRIGYTRASRLIDLMEERGVVGPQESGSKPRDVLPES